MANQVPIKYILIVLVIIVVGGIIFSISISQKPTTQYVCSNGMTVSSPNQCPTSTSSSSQIVTMPTTTTTTIPIQTIGFRSFDYDKTNQLIDALTLDSGYYDGSSSDWQLNITGYDSFGNVVFSISPQFSVSGFGGPTNSNYCNPYCTYFYIENQVPYISGGKLKITSTDSSKGVQAIGDYSYSTFDSPISFTVNSVTYDRGTNSIDYSITNTGSRIIVYPIDEYVYYDTDCSHQWTLFIMTQQNPNGNGLIGPGQTATAVGPGPSNGYSSGSYCVKLTWGTSLVNGLWGNDQNSQTYTFTVS